MTQHSVVQLDPIYKITRAAARHHNRVQTFCPHVDEENGKSSSSWLLGSLGLLRSRKSVRNMKTNWKIAPFCSCWHAYGGPDTSTSSKMWANDSRGCSMQWRDRNVWRDIDKICWVISLMLSSFGVVSACQIMAISVGWNGISYFPKLHNRIPAYRVIVIKRHFIQNANQVSGE